MTPFRYAFPLFSIVLIGLLLPLVATAQVDTLQDYPSAAPGDVLNPTVRRSTPNLKLTLHAGFNRAVYSNDRFLDNRPLDVGSVSGELDVYGSAAGFGYQTGIGLEIPRNTFFSWIVAGRYDHVNFGSDGTVQGPCISANGDTVATSAFHEFDVSIDYLKLIGGGKLNLSKFYILFGLTAEFPMSSSVRFHRSNGAATCFYPEPNDIRNSPTPVEIPEVNPVHFALRLGAGLTYRLSDRLQFSPELTLDFGFNEINKSPESDLGIYGLCAVLRYDL